MSTIARGYNLPTDNFTIVPNAWIRDERLSRRARGLLIELMSHRAGWQTSVARLAQSGTEGEAAIKTTIRELESFGYLVRTVETDKRGRRTGTRYTITDPAQSEENTRSEPSVENRPMDAEPSVENRPMEGGKTGDRPPVDFPPVVDPPPKKNTLQEDHLQEDCPEDQHRRRVVNAPHHAQASTNDAAAEFDAIKTEVDEKRGAVAMNIDLLVDACRSAGLTASFRKLTDEQRAEISGLVERVGCAALVTSAQRQYRPDSPARFVQAWLPEWRAVGTRASLPRLRPATSPVERCDRCDEFGWVLDLEHGGPIDPPQRCTHAPDPLPYPTLVEATP